MQVLRKSLSELVFDPNNARKHSQANLEAIKGSLAKFGQQKPIVINEKNIVVAGNGTLQAARSLGWDNIDCVVTTLKGYEETAFALADNRTSELAEWDDEILGKTLQSLHELDFDLSSIGFDDFDPFKDTKATEGLTDPDEVPEIEQNKFGVKLGDIWNLGNHQLMCGDSTSSVDVSKLLGDSKVDLLFTDPPYNVDYVGKTKQSLKIKNDKMDDDKFIAFLQDALTNASEGMKPGAAFYIAHADLYGFQFRYAMKLANLTVRQCIVWVKDSMVIGRQDYHWKHEPILYGWKDGAAHKWCSDRKQVTTWDFARPKRNDIHPTMKPIDLVEYAVTNNTNVGDYVLDLFLGSGSTLIACEKTGRKCYGMELDPHYCSVIIERWEQFTGKKGERIHHG